MMVVERGIERRRVREQIKIDDMQFGFRPGRGTTDAIFIVRQLQEKYRERKRICFSHSLIWRKHWIECLEKYYGRL